MHTPHDDGLSHRRVQEHRAVQGPPAVDDLIGRDTELLEVERFLVRATRSGEILVVTGPIGIGKTAMLRRTAALARRAGFTVVKVRGHRAESDLVGAGLTQLLLQLPAVEQEPMASLSGGDLFTSRLVAAVEDPLTAGTALIQALIRSTDAADAVPLMITLDDAQWFDAQSLDALTAAVQGMRCGPVALMIATQQGDGRAFTHRYPRLTLGPLEPADSERLLHRHSRFLPPPLCSRVLMEARGNPAGVIGIARSLQDSGIPATSFLAPWLPLGDPLQQDVSSLLNDLPSTAHDFLLLASVAHTERIDVLLDAAKASGIDAGGLGAAQRAGLVSVEEGQLRFTHPLLPSALHWGSSHGQRRPAHRALADVLADTPYLRALHVAAVSTEPDEETAAALEEGTAADLPHAPAVLERTADLSATAEGRAARLVKAAHAAGLRGEVQTLRRLVGRLVADPMPMSLTADACALEALIAYNDDGAPEHAVSHLLRSAAAPSTQWPPPFAPVACALAPALCEPAWGGALRPTLEAKLGEPGRENDPDLLSVLCWTDRTTYASRARALLDSAAAQHGAGALPQISPHSVAHVVTATALDDPVTTDLIGREILGPLAQQGHFGTAITVLIHLQMAHVLLGDRASVEQDADLGGYWVRAGTDIHAHLSFRMGVAQSQAWTGDEEDHQQRTDEILAYALPRRLQMLAARARWARGLMSLAHGRPEDAFDELRMLSTDDGDAWHPVVAGWALGDYVAAAVSAGRADEVREHVDRVADVNLGVGSELVRHLVARSRALLSDGDEAEHHFTAALTARSAPLRYEVARTEFAFGQWLRRQRRVLEARKHLQKARDSFTALGAEAWARGAASELIAAGEATASAHPDWAARFHLTPRETEVARLAAAGLTNQKIGWQLGLTHRTVASHLSRVYMKVGVTARGQLPSVLEPS